MVRLIDADALATAIYEWMPKDQETWMESDIPPIENLVVSIMMTIEEQPTIDTDMSEYSDRLWKIAYERGKAEAVKRGKWIKEEKACIYGKKIRLKCSECGDTFDVSEMAYPYERFCRYCGAKMEE